MIYPALNVQGVDLSSLTKGRADKQLQRSNALKLSELTRAKDVRERMGPIMTQFASGDRGEAIGAAMGVDPTQGIALMKLRESIRQGTAGRSKAEVETLLRHGGFMARGYRALEKMSNPQASYDDFKQMLRNNGVTESEIEKMPARFDPNHATLTRAAFDELKEDTLSPLTRMIREQKAYEPGSENWKRLDDAIKKSSTASEPDVVRKLRYLNVKEGSPEWKEAIAASMKGTGFRMRLPDGTEVGFGVGVADFTKPTIKSLEKKFLDAGESLARLGRIQRQYKPEHQELWERLGIAKISLKAWLSMDVSREDRAKINRHMKARRTAIENINMYIKEITGAQMSENEAIRIRLAQPDPGESWWSGDDPLTFEAKLADAIDAQLAARARYKYLLNKGRSDILQGNNKDADRIEAEIPILDELGELAVRIAENPDGRRMVEINNEWVEI